MILYFDNLITNTPLISGLYQDSEKIRSKSNIYKPPDRLSVAQYTLASYAEIEWSQVIIKYDIEDKSKIRAFEDFIKRTFPNALIIQGRSDSQEKYKETFHLIEGMGDDWIFYSGNIDHPFIASDKNIIDKAIAAANKMKKEHKYISINVSHCFEMLNAIDPSSTIHMPNLRPFSEDDNFIYCIANNYVPAGTSIINIDLLRHMLFDFDYHKKRVVRLDAAPIKVSKILLILPKKEICEHFDGYSHIPCIKCNVDEVIPPLFIPPGFFEGKIKIAFGYEEYREGWVNIHPAKEKYSFQDKHDGTDLKILIEDLPIFWKKRIELIDVNPKVDMEVVKEAVIADRKKRRELWKKRKNLDSLISKTKKAMTRLAYFKDNPDSINLESGSVFHSSAKKLLYLIFKAGHRVGILRKTDENAGKKHPK